MYRNGHFENIVPTSLFIILIKVLTIPSVLTDLVISANVKCFYTYTHKSHAKSIYIDVYIMYLQVHEKKEQIPSQICLCKYTRCISS